MSFDAFTCRAVALELERETVGARVEKVLQPSKDEIILAAHKEGKHPRIQISAGAAYPRIGITTQNPENPKVPPSFCMLARKHLTGAKITRVSQREFERVIEIEFETYDEMGFIAVRRLITEIMGRYSNAVLCDGDYKIIGALRQVDFTTSRKRQILPGMTYEMPPKQEGKTDPLGETEQGFLEKIKEPTEEEIMRVYSGFSPLTARELVFRLGKRPTVKKLWKEFSALIKDTRAGNFSPTLVINSAGDPVEFSAFGVLQYGILQETKEFGTFGELCDAFYSEKERYFREKQRAHATEKMLKNVESRIERKLEAQRKELEATEKKTVYKLQADALTANMYNMKNASGKQNLTLYVPGPCGDWDEVTVEVEIEQGMKLGQYAQKLYKKYNKAKNAEREISAQIAKGENELAYIRSVLDELTRINGQSELEEIRRELEEAGYGKKTQERKLQSKAGYVKKTQPLIPIKKETSGGFTVLIGKNNLQNDQITFRTASKNDIWFHVKDVPGSHTVLITDGREPDERDLTEAAVFAAENSRAAGQYRVSVDYTRVKNVKKPSGAKPGYVIYDNYNTAVVPADGSYKKNERNSF